MKIGILTFHYAHNYGAMLQAYALNTYLNKHGYDARIIDYRLPYIYRVHELLNFKQLYLRYSGTNSRFISLLKTLKNYYKHRRKNEKWHKFDMFLNETLLKTKRINKQDEIQDLGFDAIICGSDQIWNSSLTGHLEPIYFCEGLSNILKIAYAASNGSDVVSEKDWFLFRQLISNFDAISVREQGLSNFLNDSGFKNTVVLDPIFLLEKDDWCSICSKVTNQPYLLTYSFNEDPFFFNQVKDIAEKKGLRIFSILYKKYESLDSSYTQITNAGPIEFLSLFRYASFVVTNSFHGTAFSIMFNKQFYSIPPQKGRERIDSLLQELDLTNRICSKQLTVPAANIDYHIVNKKLSVLRDESYKFLNNALNRSNNEHSLC